LDQSSRLHRIDRNLCAVWAGSADDQSSMELAQKLAAQSIMRLAGLRNIASASALS